MAPSDDLQRYFDESDFEPRFVTRYGIAKFKALLAKASNPNESGSDGRTALFLAARAGRHEHLMALLESGAGPNQTDAADEAPLQVASRYGYLECVRALLAAGADVNHLPSAKKTKYSETALCSAVRKERVEVVRELLSAGADPNLFSEGDFFNTPLQSVAFSGHLELCELLLAKGANPNLYPSKDSRIPLHDAIRGGHVQVVKMLLKHGANPNSRDSNGYTPVMAALNAKWHGFDPMPFLFALLAAKADLNVRNKLGETALSFARESRLTEAAELLRQSGATEAVEDDRDSEGEEITPGGTARFKLVSRKEVDPTKADVQMVERLLATSPKIAASLGWESSPRHWRILEFASDPQPLERIAYAVRGGCNAPKGRELADGPAYLGESYETAVKRFVDLGLLEKLSVPDAAARNSSADELQKSLRRLGVRGGGSKVELLRRLESISSSELEQLGRRKDWFIRTSKGAEKVQALAHGEPVFRWKVDRPELFDLIFDSFKSRNLEAGLLTFLEWQSSQGQKRRLSAETVRDTREILNQPMSDDMVFESKEESAIRAAAAVVSLVGIRSDDHGIDNWKRWGVRVPPHWEEDELNEEKIHLPSEFAYHLLHQDVE